VALRGFRRTNPSAMGDGGLDAVDNGHRNALLHLVGHAGKRRAGQDDDVGGIVPDGAVGEIDEHLFLLVLHIVDRTKSPR